MRAAAPRGERVSHESLFEESEAPYAALCVVANFTTDGE